MQGITAEVSIIHGAVEHTCERGLLAWGCGCHNFHIQAAKQRLPLAAAAYPSRSRIPAAGASTGPAPAPTLRLRISGPGSGDAGATPLPLLLPNAWGKLLLLLLLGGEGPTYCSVAAAPFSSSPPCNPPCNQDIL